MGEILLIIFIFSLIGYLFFSFKSAILKVIIKIIEKIENKVK